MVAVVYALTSGSGSSPDGEGRADAASPAAKPARARARRSERANRRELLGLRRVLSYTPFIARGSPRRREVALTFDDGPGPYTGQVVQILRRERAPATFFTIGEQVPARARELRAMSRAGFEIADHTQNHARMTGLDVAGQYRQIADQELTLRAAGVRQARLFRPPFGLYDDNTLALLRGKRMLMVLWSVDTSDYTRPGVGAIVDAAVRGAAPGAIVLLHDGGGIRDETVSALPQIIRELRARRLRLVTVSRLLLDDPPPRSQRAPPPTSGG